MSAALKMLPQAIAASRGSAPEVIADNLVVTTRMRELDLIRSALDAVQIKHRDYEGVLYADPQDESVLFGFVPSKRGALDAHFPATSDPLVASEIIGRVEDEYLRHVQEYVYKRIVEQSEQQGFAVVATEVEEDNAVVLTLEIR